MDVICIGLNFGTHNLVNIYYFIYLMRILFIRLKYVYFKKLFTYFVFNFVLNYTVLL